MITKKTQQLKNEEYQVFILIDAAHQDFVFCENEKRYIIKEYGLACFAKVFKTYQVATEYDKELCTRRFFRDSSQSALQELRNKLIELYLSDGKFCRFEKRYNNYIDTLSEKILQIQN